MDINYIGFAFYFLPDFDNCTFQLVLQGNDIVFDEWLVSRFSLSIYS